MKVGVNARTFCVEEPDGAVQSARQLTLHLSKKSDIELVLYGSNHLASLFPAETVVHTSGFVLNSPFYGVLWERTILPVLARSDGLDVLLCPNGNAPFVPVGCPIVTYVHDVNARKGMSSNIHRIYRQAAVPLSVRNSERIITVSEFSKKEIVEQLSVKEADVSVVYNGVDEFYLQEGGSEPMDLPEQYVLYVGAMNPRKNVERLVRAFRMIEDDVPHDLVLIGPQNKSEYQNMDIVLSSRVITPGFVPKEQLKYAYENADVFVYPSCYEGFGLPPLEAMACGTPVVASTSASLPEILGNLATLVDPLDTEAIAKAIHESANRRSTVEERCRLREHAADFTWERASEELWEVLSDVAVPEMSHKSVRPSCN